MRQFIGATAHRCMVSHEANGILGTRWIVICGTWINAVFVDAGTVSGAFIVGMAFDAFATFEGAAFVSGWAAASRPMIVTEAFSIDSTWIADGAWIDAFTVVALFVVGAFSVGLATQFDTSELGVSRVAWFTAADWMMVGDVTLGIGTTITWTNAEFVHARFG